MVNAHFDQPRRKLNRLLASALLCATFGSATSLALAADSYPDRPINLVVAYPPGGGVDAVARILANAMTKTLKQSVVIQNRPGAGGTIGAQSVVRAPADGYTLLLADPAFAVTPTLMSNTPYDLAKDFKSIATVTTSPLVLSVPVSSPIKSVAQLQDLGRKSSAGLTYSSAGIGSSPHMSGELFRLKTKANYVHVPYRGSGLAMADLIAGNIDFSFSTMAAAMPFIRDGKLRALAITGPERVAEIKDAVPLAESLPGFDVRFWTTLVARADTPPEIMKALSAAVQAALQTEEVKTSLHRVGETPSFMPMDQSEAFVMGEWKRWGAVVKDANITLN